MFKWANPKLNDSAPLTPILLSLKKVIKKIDHLIFRLIQVILKKFGINRELINYYRCNVNVCRLFKWANPKLNDSAPLSPI